MALPIVDMAPEPVHGTADTLAGTSKSKPADILFLIDNSGAMVAKQKQLALVIGDFLSLLEQSGSDYHIGVVTSDIGTLPPPGDPFPGNNGLLGCAPLMGATSCGVGVYVLQTRLIDARRIAEQRH